MPNKRYRSTFVLALTLMLSIMPVRSMAEVAAYHPVVDDLVLRLDDRPQLKQLLSDAIDVADVDGVDSLEAFYSYTSELMGWVPVEREVVSR